MRMKNLIAGDVKFQFKYGFYFVYVVFTIVYAAIINILPYSWKETAATIMIFSDPAAMGLFFMGAIVLLEKSERVLNSIAVSPVSSKEYILSKVISLGFISTIVGLIIALSAESNNLLIASFGIFVGSSLFTLIGLIIAANAKSLNQFIVATVPIEIICFLPPIWYLFGYDKTFMLLHPGCILIRFISGNSDNLFMLTAILFIWITAVYLIAYNNIEKMFQQTGGTKL